MDEFEAIYARYYQDVYRFALFLTSDPARAEDLAAETFVRAWGALGRVRQPTLKAYLLTITRNLYRDARRKDRVVRLDESLPLAGPSLEAQVERASTLRGIRARLRGIARGDRRALLMYVVRGMSYEEIARALGISVGAVKSRIRLVRRTEESSICDLRFGLGDLRYKSARVLDRARRGGRRKRNDDSGPRYWRTVSNVAQSKIVPPLARQSPYLSAQVHAPKARHTTARPTAIRSER